MSAPAGLFPRVGVGVIVERAGRVLLIQRGGDHGGGTWSTPGGHLEYGETPAACAIREVREEVGVTIADVRCCGLTNDLFPESGKHYITIWMRGTLSAGEPAIRAPAEVTAIAWCAWDALPAPLFLPLQHWVAGEGERCGG